MIGDKAAELAKYQTMQGPAGQGIWILFQEQWEVAMGFWDGEHLISTLKDHSDAEWREDCRRGKAIADTQEKMVAGTVVEKWTWGEENIFGNLFWR